MTWLVAAVAFLLALFMLGILVVKLNDALERRKAQRAATSSTQVFTEPHNLSSLAGFFGRPLPPGLRRWTAQSKEFPNPLPLPSPNSDLFVTGIVALTPESMRLLNWKPSLPYVPVALLEDGDLLVADLHPPADNEIPIYAYFHDGGQVERIYGDIAELAEALSLSTRE